MINEINSFKEEIRRMKYSIIKWNIIALITGIGLAVTIVKLLE